MAFRRVIQDFVMMLVAWMFYTQNSSHAQVYDQSDKAALSVVGTDPEYIDYSMEWSSDSFYSNSSYSWEDITCRTESCELPHVFRICRCDPLCDFFEDCCRDYNATDSSNSALNLFKDADLWECVDFGIMCADLLPDVQDEHFQLISNCPKSWSDERVRISCQQKDGTVVLDDRGLHFLNEYCALCNEAKKETIRPYLEFQDHLCPAYDFKCAYFPVPDNESSSHPRVPDPHLCFPDMVQSCPLNRNVSDITRRQCETDFAPIAFYNRLFRNEECALCHGKVPNKFSNCPGTKRYYGPYVTCVGKPLYFTFFDFNEKQQLVAKIFFGISCAALTLTFFTYCVFSTLRNIQGILVMQFIVALYMAQVLMQFVTPGLNAESVVLSNINPQGTNVCVAVACASHFFSLSAFSLMSVMALDLSRSLTFSKSVTRRDSISRKRLLAYSICGWGFPVLVVGPCLGVHALSVKNRSFKLFYYGGSDCWLHPSLRTIQAFLVPVLICLFFNLLIFIRVICQLRAIKKECKVLKTGQSSEQQRKDTAAALRLYIKISCLFGFGWLFGYLGAFVKVSQLWYLFIILNSLQGVLFFFSFGMNARTRKLWRETFTKRLGQFSSSFVTLSTFIGRRTENSTSRSMPTSNESETKV